MEKTRTKAKQESMHIILVRRRLVRRRLVRKKSQVRMSESVAIMFVFFVLVVFGLVFYARVQTRDVNIQRTQIQDLKAVEIAQVFSFLPEIQCTADNSATPNCIDVMKVEIFRDMIRNDNAIKQYYYDQLLRSRIIIKEIYPDDGKNWTVYDNSQFNWKKKVSTQLPVTLYNATGNPVAGKFPYYGFGVIEIEYYS